jgi:hypothetical protein
VITPAVRAGDYRGVGRNDKATKRIYRSILSNLERNPYVAMLRLWVRGWNASLYLLKQADILCYLNMHVLAMLHGLDGRAATELMHERKDIKGALRDALGVPPGEGLIREVCMAMAREAPVTDGMTLIRPSPFMLDEITGIIELVAMRQGYVP